MDKSACPSFGHQSCSLDELNEQQDPSTTAPPQSSMSVVRNASMVHWPGGGSPCFNSMTCRHGRCLCSCHHWGYPHPWPFTKYNGNEYSFFGKLAKPYPKDLSPRNIEGNFISLIVRSRKCQETYPKTRKVKGFYEALTVEKKDILGDAPPSSSAREVQRLVSSCEEAREVDTWCNYQVHLHHLLLYARSPGSFWQRGNVFLPTPRSSHLYSCTASSSPRSI